MYLVFWCYMRVSFEQSLLTYHEMISYNFFPKVKHIITFYCIILLKSLICQYSYFPGHSHNDYFQNIPLSKALELGYKSIEVDVCPYKGKLVVSHNIFNLEQKPDINDLYINQLKKYFADKNIAKYSITLLIDIKNKKSKALKLIRKMIRQNPELFFPSYEGGDAAVKIILSGKIPFKHLTPKDLQVIKIDGRFFKSYKNKIFEHIPLISYSYAKLKKKYDRDCLEVIRELVLKSHAKGIKVRFWRIPHKEEIWDYLLSIGVDYLSVDNLALFEDYYQKSEIRTAYELYLSSVSLNSF